MYFCVFCSYYRVTKAGSGHLVMAKDPLAEAGLHFDELNKLRVLEPDVSQKTTELNEECEDFVDSEFFILFFILCRINRILCFFHMTDQCFFFENRDRSVSENRRWTY